MYLVLRLGWSWACQLSVPHLVGYTERTQGEEAWSWGLMLRYHELLTGKNFADLSLCNDRDCQELLESDAVGWGSVLPPLYRSMLFSLQDYQQKTSMIGDMWTEISALISLLSASVWLFS